MRNHRARWSAIGAAVAVSVGAGGLITFASASGGSASTFTPITPCRLLDTRGAGLATGATPPRTTPLGQGESLTVPARGDFGNCAGLSATDTGAVLNVTIVNPTAGSFLTVWPADKARPLASSLNWIPFQAATPNQVTTALDPSGQFSIFNNGGTVDVIIDVVGLYEQAGASGGSGGGSGPQGGQGAQGAQGAQGPEGSVGPSGQVGPAGSTGPAGPAGPVGSANLMTAASPAPASSGQFTSVVLDAAGNPVISHYDSVNGDLLLTHCNDPACAPGGDVTNIVDRGGGNDVGQYTSLALEGTLPVISYYDATAGNLNVARCDDANCATETINPVDTAHDVGQYSSLALDGGLPVISYYDATDHDLKLVRCGDPACVPLGNVSNVVDSGGGVGYDVGVSSSLALDTDGNPIISYYNSSTETIQLAHCNLTDCSGPVEINNVVNTPLVTEQNADLVLDGNGFPVISFQNLGAVVAVAHCADAFCFNTATVRSLGAAGQPSFSSIALDANGFPVVSFVNAGAGPLVVAKCSDVDCTIKPTVSIADNATGDRSGTYSSIVLDGSGNPVISSYDSVAETLVVTRCVDPYCNPFRIRTIGG